MKLAAATFVALAACAHHTPAPAPAPANHGGDAPAVTGPYAALFVAGAQWTYTLSTSATPPQTATMTCKVASVTPAADETRATITCDKFLDENEVSNPLVGDWVADPHGLWRVDPAGERPRELVMPKSPTPSTTPHFDRTAPEGADGEPVGTTTIKQDGDAWCWNDVSNLGDTQWRSLCFSKAGVSAGYAGWQGDSATQVTFTLVRGTR